MSVPRLIATERRSSAGREATSRVCSHGMPVARRKRRSYHHRRHLSVPSSGARLCSSPKRCAEAFTLREVARRVGVSHAAAWRNARHFAGTRRGARCHRQHQVHQLSKRAAPSPASPAPASSSGSCASARRPACSPSNRAALPGDDPPSGGGPASRRSRPPSTTPSASLPPLRAEGVGQASSRRRRPWTTRCACTASRTATRPWPPRGALPVSADRAGEVCMRNLMRAAHRIPPHQCVRRCTGAPE